MLRDSFTDGYLDGVKAAQATPLPRMFCPVDLTDHHEPRSVLRYREGYNAGLRSALTPEGTHV